MGSVFRIFGFGAKGWIAWAILLSLPSWAELPAGRESYLSRTDINTLTPRQHPDLPPIWGKVKSALPETLALFLEAYPTHDLYFLARDGEAVYDFARAVLKDSPEDMKRVHLINISRANVYDPKLLSYLYQEGISKKNFKEGKKVLLIDTGFSGTISQRIALNFFDETDKQLQTHLLLSETPKYPSTRSFLAGLTPWSAYLSPEELHGKIIALEHIAHETERSDRFLLIDGRWHPTSLKGAASDGGVSPEKAKRFQEDLLAFSQGPEARKRLADRRKVWKEIRKLHDNNDKAGLIRYFSDLRKKNPGEEWPDTLARDYLNLLETNLKDSPLSRMTSAELGISKILDFHAARLAQIEKTHPALSELINEPDKLAQAINRKRLFAETSG